MFVYSCDVTAHSYRMYIAIKVRNYLKTLQILKYSRQQQSTLSFSYATSHTVIYIQFSRCSHFWQVDLTRDSKLIAVITVWGPLKHLK